MLNLSQLACGLWVIGACAVLVPAFAADEVAGEAPKSSVARAKKIWTENCGRCHNVRDPKDLQQREIPAVMKHMQVRAGLTNDEVRDLLTLFLREE